MIYTKASMTLSKQDLAATHAYIAGTVAPTRFFIIVNPISGRGNGESTYPIIEARMRDLGLSFELVRTTAAGDAIGLAEQASLEGFDIVVAVGGDGTANEVLNGLVLANQKGPRRAALGLIPVGRGNDFAFGAGIATGLEQAFQALAGGNRKWIDVGCVRGGDYPSGRFFGNGVGIGFDAVVGFEALKLKRLHGFPSYIVAALKTIFLYFRAPTVLVEFDGQELVLPALMVSIMNGRRMGGGFFMAPAGQLDDGFFDLCIARQVSRGGIISLILRFMKGSQQGHPAVFMRRARQVKVTALQGSLPAHADGETVCQAGSVLELSLIPRMLEVIVPTDEETG
jgi:diacylglycerol kinase (ATP)